MYDELVKRLKARADREDDYYEHGGDVIRKAADAIEELNKLLDGVSADNDSLCEKIERMQKPCWIPVTERLPNCNGCYLVWRPHFFGGEIGMPNICYFDGSNTWYDSYGVDFERILHPDDVTHWMPLPEPPKEETE